MPASAPLIEGKDLALSYGQQLVLDRVSLKVSPGEIVTVVGPNGAGKTTLLKILLGLALPDAGRIQSKPNLRIGYVPQKLDIAPTLPLSAKRFLQMAAPQGNRAIEAALKRVGAPKVLETPLLGLSGGELQRVLLARALLRNPELLVLDEPVRGVDLAGQADLYELIADLRKQMGLGVIMVSHDLHLVMQATDEVLCLNGHVCCHGHPEAVSRHPEFVALFGPRVAETMALYPHHHDHVHK
ncbi:zinc transporter subunit: ATP-binding component of ABC superfamily [Rhodospirillaceae bacterium LM-1]|nr:zinc transporter subunit: ATP-binding component of ABC superfamily [Rhodospirillaceae bacterium LM-1]